jgi:hypothetical protein
MRYAMRVQILKYYHDFGNVKNFDLMTETVVVMFNKISEASSFAVLDYEK